MVPQRRRLFSSGAIVFSPVVRAPVPGTVSLRPPHPAAFVARRFFQSSLLAMVHILSLLEFDSLPFLSSQASPTSLFLDRCFLKLCATALHLARILHFLF